MALLAPGTQIGGYRIESVLGRGGMGAVYEATQISLGRTVALKILDADLGADPAFRERFRREARIQAGLDHPHIVTVHEAGEAPEGIYIAMRLIRGDDLKTLIRAGDLEPERALRILRPVGEALDAAHETGLTHRDIKPGNILVGRADHPYLADFGLTKAMGETGYTRTGQFLGTLDYVAPEQIQGEAARESDIYAFAAVAYECLTGQVPFVKASEAALLWAHIAEPPPLASVLQPQLGTAVDAVLARGMAKATAERPATASAFVAELDDALARADRAATTVVGPRRATPAPPEPDEPEPAPTAPRRRSRRLPLAAAGLTVLAAAAVAVVALTGGEPEAPAGKTRALAGREVSLRVPATWRTLAEAPDVAGLKLRNAVAAAGGGGTVVAGRADGEGPTLLPAAFAKSLSEPPKGEAVRLGAAQAYRYADLRPPDAEKPVTVFTVPTDADVATVACSGVAASTCDAAAATLVVRGARPLGPSAAYAKAIRALLSDLRRRRAPALRRLSRADTARGQAAAARDVADAYGRAAQKARTAPAGPNERAATGRLAGALDAAARAWDRLAAAAGSGSSRRYGEARGAVVAADRNASLAVIALGPLGY